jgi:L-ascorbate metabolism protein UlaG (beta-lactamase superfamily)
MRIKINQYDMLHFRNLCLLFAVVFLVGLTPPEDSLKITYIGNCGFLYENKNFKIIIDPFGTQYGELFQLPSSQLMGKIVAGLPPFDNVQLLLISHFHGDHFDSKLTEQFLLHNKSAILICPSQVLNVLKDSCRYLESIKSRIIIPSMENGKFDSVQLKGLNLKVLKLQHGSTRNLETLSYSEYTDYEKTENLGFVFQMSGKYVFHQGDGSLKLNRNLIKSINTKLDIAHLGFFDKDSTSLALLYNVMKARNIIVMHSFKLDKSAESEKLKKLNGNLIVYDKELDFRKF